MLKIELIAIPISIFVVLYFLMRSNLLGLGLGPKRNGGKRRYLK